MYLVAVLNKIPLNVFDIVVLIIWILAIIQGIRKGIIRQAFGLLALFWVVT